LIDVVRLWDPGWENYRIENASSDAMLDVEVPHLAGVPAAFTVGLKVEVLRLGIA
jgi:hypothetical protein